MDTTPVMRARLTALCHFLFIPLLVEIVWWPESDISYIAPAINPGVLRPYYAGTVFVRRYSIVLDRHHILDSPLGLKGWRMWYYSPFMWHFGGAHTVCFILAMTCVSWCHRGLLSWWNESHQPYYRQSMRHLQGGICLFHSCHDMCSVTSSRTIVVVEWIAPERNWNSHVNWHSVSPTGLFWGVGAIWSCWILRHILNPPLSSRIEHQCRSFHSCHMHCTKRTNIWLSPPPFFELTNLVLGFNHR